jgi:flagellar protein FliS
MNAGSSYREATIRGASPVRLVLCLYEQAIEDLRRAVVAQEKGDIEARTREINHAVIVIGQLQRSLNMEQGGEVARNLARFYGTVRAGLTEAHARQSAPLLEEQISQLVMIHGAWLEVERATSVSAAAPPPADRDSETGSLPGPAIFATDWSA